MKKIHNVEALNFMDDTLILSVDGQEYSFALSEISKKLRNASDNERNTYRVMASGYGSHWPLLDEDLSVDGLLGIPHTLPARLNTYSKKSRIVRKHATKVAVHA